MEPASSGVKAWQWIVTIIVIVILVIIGIIVFGGKKAGVPTDNSVATTTGDTSLAGSNRIVMTDQYPGDVVNVSSVTLDQPGYVAIQSDNNGQPGAVIGSAHFDKGINPGKITLTKPTVEGGTYYAVLHADDGDGKFDAVKDAPLTDVSGNVIMKIFRASASVGAGLKG